MSDIRLRKATAADIPALVPLIAQAFAPMPLTVWLLGEGPEALRRGEHSAELEFRYAQPYDLTFTTNDLRGAAVWYPPNARQRLWTRLTLLWDMTRIVGLSRKAWRQMMLFHQADQVHPKAPHYYLRMLAVAPQWQGQGIGSALLRPILEICDQERLPAYLETDAEIDVRFYERHSFRVGREIPVRDAGLCIWTLWREPAPLASKSDDAGKPERFPRQP